MDQLRFDTPLGAMVLLAEDGALRGAYFPGQAHAPMLDASRPQSESPLLLQAREELLAYFGGGLRRFGVPMAPRGTEFQRGVWAALGRIEPGRTVSYAGLAREVGRPAAVRAVAQAVGRNPLIILVPCHRVIGSSGALTGFAAGIERKRQLLALEGVALGRAAAVAAATAAVAEATAAV